MNNFPSGTRCLQRPLPSQAGSCRRNVQNFVLVKQCHFLALLKSGLPDGFFSNQKSQFG
jgi:hypothetical protein